MQVLSRSLFLVLLFSGFISSLQAQTATTIPDTEAAQHVGQQATVEGAVVKVYTSKNGNTFLNFGSSIREPKLYRLDSERFASCRGDEPTRPRGVEDLNRGDPRV